MVDVQCLSDYELHKQLKKLGFSSGPILPSTRKMYEKKLVQLLVSPRYGLRVMKRPKKPPCELGVMKKPKKLHGPEDSDEDPAVNIILKGNIKVSKEKGKECKKKPVNETKRQQGNTGKSNSDCKNWKMLIKRPEASPNKRGTLDIYRSQKPTKGVRYAVRPVPRIKHGYVTKEDSCQGIQSLKNSFLFQNPGDSVPWSLKLAILGIFIIVLFVYITVEKKPLLP